MSLSRAKRALATASTIFAMTAGTAATTGTTSASAATIRPACTAYPLLSKALINESTGVSSWSYGHLELDYTTCAGGQNFAYLSSGLGAGTIQVIVYNTAGASNCNGADGVVGLSSGSITSPNNAAGTWGELVVNGVGYYAEVDQSGASSSDYTGSC